MIKTRYLFLTAALLLAVASAALAFPPKSKLIVPGTSIGGIKPGETLAKAKSAWGTPTQCVNHHDGSKAPIECFYRANPITYAVAGYQATTTGKIKIIYIAGDSTQAGFQNLKSFHTSKGIGLGSSRHKLTSAYPALKKIGTSGLYYCMHNRRVYTCFKLDPTYGVVDILLHSR